MDRFCTICSFQPKTYAGLAKHTARCYSRHLAQQSLEPSENVHIYAADGLSSTVTVYDHIKKDKNADLAIADGISDALDICAKDDLIRRKVLFQTHDRRLAGEPATAESITAKDPNYVDTFSLDFAFSFAAWLQRIKCTLGDINSLFADNILSLIAFIISHRLFADELVYASNRATVVPIIILVDKTQLLLISGDRSIPSTLLARFIPITKIRDPLLKKNAAKCLNKGHDDFVHLVDCFGWKHYNFNIHVSLATDTLHLLLKGLTSTEQKAIIQQLMAVISPLFVSKAPFALHFIRAVCDLVTLAQYKRALERINVFKEEFRVYRRTLGEEKNFNYPKWHALTHIIQDIRMYRALDSICTRANSEAHYITIVKQFYSMTNKKEYILQICLHNSRRTALLAADYATVVKQNRTYSTRVTRPLPFRRLRWSIPGIQPYSTKLPLSEVAANIAISDFTHAAAVFLHLILIIIDYTRYDKDRKHMAYIEAFSEVLLFNNNRQINNTTRMLSVRRRAWNAASKRRTLQAFKFYDLSTIICSVHLVPRDLPNSTTRTTMSYYVNNYID
ncbi:hypothetical protein HBI92_246190 [Parastagonospora nodorum]|nr:hypothetical protein HBI97_249920 [Parastagonospora nodorum]KAH5845672.1 hypothetical protein HBI90_246970 [Parastagonospora nodorum]KAH5846024.1 hypothetical protein HBI92_246190 [Parastagonospora nodorum]KAH5921456.1 hypothetical protein HBI86_246230 [Parastagonospora nodorum]KAH5949014.1 hypothetical protein HBI87_105600 [Parastagonospora nodorum]